MVASSIFALCIILSNVVNHSYCRKIHRKPPHQHEIPNAAKDIQMMHVKPTIQPANFSRSQRAAPKSNDKPVDKQEQIHKVQTDELSRGRGTVSFAEGAAYAEIQPKKSLIGACIAFAVYFVGTMIYNYIRKLIEQERVAKAMRDYEQEKEHYIETGETIDIAGAGA
ncbi:putative membrane protein [Babesia divergens]|uniref:Membrane protein n=1 Tax=Babesia divergens TaxID=32595 RepID=A0AAD9G908_BABDI|nr:putative membrane protein [Babesia divergens]